MNIRKLGRLDNLIESQREKGKLQGATILVEHNGKRKIGILLNNVLNGFADMVRG